MNCPASTIRIYSEYWSKSIIYFCIVLAIPETHSFANPTDTITQNVYKKICLLPGIKHCWQ